MEAANAPAIAKIVMRLKDLGSSADIDTTIADAAAFRRRTLSLLAHELVAKVPLKVRIFAFASEPQVSAAMARTSNACRNTFGHWLTVTVPRRLQGVSVADMQGHLMLHRQDPFAAVIAADFGTQGAAITDDKRAGETKHETAATTAEAAPSPSVQTPPVAAERRKAKVL